MDNEPRNFKVGDRVKIVALPAYIKTAEPMPMLRSPDVLAIGEAGTILNRLPGGYYGIRFVQGAYLLEGQYLKLMEN
ncbi:MAG: regulatory protein SipA [Waterburya sp.]